MKKIPKFERELVFQHGEFPLNVSTWEKHPDYPLHTHDFSEIAIITQGTGMNVLGEEEHPITSGDVFVFHSASHHGYRNTDNLTVINVLYDPAVLDMVKLDIAGLPGYQALFVVEPRLRRRGHYERHLRLDTRQLAQAQALTDAIEKELHGSIARHQPTPYTRRLDFQKDIQSSTAVELGSRFISLGYFMVLVSLLSRWYTHKPSVEADIIIGIGRAIRHIEMHFSEGMEGNELAKIAGMSRRSFYRIFQKVTGESPLSYCQRIRVLKAARLLETTNETITEIAFACGFEDGNYFARQFRKAMEMSPRKFRSRYKISS